MRISRRRRPCTVCRPCSRAGAVHVEVELRYQTIGFPWAHNLDGYDAPEPKRFVSYYTPCHQVRRSWLPLRRRDSAPRPQKKA